MAAKEYGKFSYPSVLRFRGSPAGHDRVPRVREDVQMSRKMIPCQSIINNNFPSFDTAISWIRYNDVAKDQLL